MRECQKKAIKKYKEKVKRITIEFAPTEAELLDHINKQPKKQTYIKDLIRKDMRKSQMEERYEKIREIAEMNFKLIYIRQKKEILEMMAQNPPRGYKFNENGDLVVDSVEAEKIKDEIRRLLGETQQSAIIDEKTFAEVQEKLNNEKK
jgi:hypothetical protein